MPRRQLILIAAIVGGLSLGLAALDSWHEPLPFAAFESALLLGAVVVLAWITADVRDLRLEQAEMREDLERAVELGAAWRAGNKAQVDSLSGAILQEFEAWALTPAEVDIAGLLLKGVSLRDIARLRGTSETTIRQQAQAIYRKSGLGGRTELAAYFLDSLFGGVRTEMKETRSA